MDPVSRRALCELADLAVASAAEKRNTAGRWEALSWEAECGDSSWKPTTVSLRMLMVEAIRAVLIGKHRPEPLLRAQLSEPLTPFQRMNSPADSASVGLLTSSTSAQQCLVAALSWGHF